jgi:hypothetical protein
MEVSKNLKQYQYLKKINKNTSKLALIGAQIKTQIYLIGIPVLMSGVMKMPLQKALTKKVIRGVIHMGVLKIMDIIWNQMAILKAQ